MPAETDLEQMFCETFRRIQAGARAFAERCLNREDAKDAFAEAIAQLWYNWRTLLPEQRTDAYFFGILCHKIRDAQREGPTWVSLEDAEDELDRRATDGRQSHAAARAILDLLDETVAGMPPQRRTVYHLVHEEEFTYKEVAAVLRVSEATVNRHVTLGNASVRAAFVREGYRLPQGKLTELPSPDVEVRSDD